MIAYNSKGKRKGYPIMGDNISIAADEALSGNIRIGNNIIIGANAVVLNDLPD